MLEAYHIWGQEALLDLVGTVCGVLPFEVRSFSGLALVRSFWTLMIRGSGAG